MARAQGVRSPAARRSRMVLEKCLDTEYECFGIALDDV